jgi:hypothetical protein
LRPAAAFCAFVPPRDDVERDFDVLDGDRARLVPDLLVPEVERERLVVERGLLVPVDRALLVPVEREVVERDLLAPVDRALLAPVERGVVERDLLVPVDRALLVPVERALLVPVERERDVVDREDVDRDFAAVALPPLRPAARFCAVVPPRLEVERDDARVPVERDRDVVDRGDVDRFAAVVRPPLAPAAFFCALVPPRRAVDFDVVERLRLVVERAELRDVPDLARVVPEVDRERVPVVDRRGEAALAREMPSSLIGSPPNVSSPTRSGAIPCSPKRSGSSSLLCSSK